MGEPNKKHKILVIDDEAEVTEMVATNLTEHGYEVETLTKPRAAAEVALRFKPDVILLDYIMPKASGSDVLHNLRRMARFAKTPIVFVSAVAPPTGNNADPTTAGGGPVQKPVEMADLVKRIEAELKALEDS